MADGFFMVRLQSQEDNKRAYFEGPWKIADHYLIVQRWRPLFSWSAALATKIAVWIRIPKLPLELCNEIFLSRIGNIIGTMLKVDQVTALHSRGKFARICVEIDLEKQLPSHILIRGVHVCLEYEGLHSICFRCGKYDHKKDHCKEFMGNEPPVANTTVPVDSETPSMNACSTLVVVDKDRASPKSVTGDPIQQNEDQDLGFGPWNIPKKFQKKKSHQPKVVVQPTTKPVSGGGFKYSNNQQQFKPEQSATKKRTNADVMVEVKQSAPATVRVRNPAAGKNKQSVNKGFNKPVNTISKTVEREVKIVKNGNMTVNKENASTSKDGQNSSNDEHRLKMKERDDKVLEYMRYMSDAERRDILNQIESAFMPRVALRQIEDNFSNVKNSNSQLENLDVVPMETTGIVGSQTPKSCQ